MKITILANKDLSSCIALNYLAPSLLGHDLSIFLSSRVGKSNQLPTGLKELQFYEQELFNSILFPRLHCGIDEKTELLSFDGLAELIGKPIEELNQINTVDFERLQQTEPDLILSIRYGVILKAPAIALPKHGVINLHSGLLPDYKGVMATFRALLNGDDEIGMSLHFIEDGTIDTGSIIGTTLMAVNRERSYLWHVLELYQDGCSLVLDTIQQIEDAVEVSGSRQEPGGSYYSFPSDAELKAFSEMGCKLTDSDEIMLVVKKFLSA